MADSHHFSHASSTTGLDYQSVTVDDKDPASVKPSTSHGGLVWNSLEYQVPLATKGFRKVVEWRTLLNNVSGNVAPGEMVAIMGSSGAGKSTLLNALAGRLKTGKLKGQVLYNGAKRNPRLFKKQAAYVEQDDLLYPQLTVRETIQYAATLKLPSREFSKEAKARRVDEVIEWLRLSGQANTMIGDAAVRGVSGGERKRTAIGVELVTDPGFLFLDEATSGLDSNSALHVCQVVKDLCRRRQNGVLMTIHQPSAKVFNLFDKVILLCKGEVVYSGRVADSLDYFARLGYSCGQHENPADFFLDLMTPDDSDDQTLADSQERIRHLVDSFQKYQDMSPMSRTSGDGSVHGTERLAGYTESSPLAYADGIHSSDNATPASSIPGLNDTLLPGKMTPTGSSPVDPTVPRQFALKTTTPNKVVPHSNTVHEGWALPWIQELIVLFDRCWKAQIRSKFQIIGLLARSIVMALFMGFTFFQLDTNQSSIQNRIGFLFFIPIDLTFGSVMPMLMSFTLQADIMARERSGGAYRVSSFYLAKFLTELPFFLAFDAVYLTAIYFLAHLQYDAAKFFIFLGVCLLHVVVAVSLGMAIGSFFRNLRVTQMFAPLIITIFLIFGGNLVNNDDVTPVLSWIRYTSLITYTYHALSHNEFDGLTFSCGNSLTEQTTGCVATGADALQRYGLDSFSIGMCIGLICALAVAFHVCIYASLRWKAKPRYIWV
ncbi:hypothetical protein H4R33_001471 [Dimargaris cristalligena]|nr:hypothetical protein H4R33_001471 [Dimargaris cristalligena]